MAESNVLVKDVNSVAVAGGVSDLDGVTILPITINHSTGRVKVSAVTSGIVVVGWVAVSGTIDGTNATFTLPVMPASDIILVLGGQTQIKTKWYVVSGNTITYQAGFIPIGVPTNEHMAYVIS